MFKFDITKLKYYRNKYELKQREICLAINSSDVSYRYWENGTRIPSKINLDKLEEYFDEINNIYESEKYATKIKLRESEVEVKNGN